MLFSKDGETYWNYAINGKNFTEAMHSAAKSLRIEDREKIYYKENEKSNPLIFIYREKG